MIAPFVLWKSETEQPATEPATGAIVEDIDPDIAGAAYSLAEFAGLTDEPADPDFAALPKAVQLAVLTIGTWTTGGPQEPSAGEPAAPSTPTGRTSADARDEAVIAAAGRPVPKLKVTPAAVAKAETVPHTKAATAVKERRLQPGEGRKMASDVIAADVKRIRKEHPNWSEAKTWSWALENDPHAIETYNRGELAERELRRPTG